MSYGIQITNPLGNIIIDDTLPQFRLIASGTAAAYWTIETMQVATVNFSTLNNPIILVRSTLNSRFTIRQVTSSSFTYQSEGPLDYRIYETDQAPSVSGYGLHILSAGGKTVFDSQRPPPHIFTQTAINITYQNSDDLVTTLSFADTAIDGGYPFVNASALGVTKISDNSEYSEAFSFAARFTSATSMQVRAKCWGEYSSWLWDYTVGQNPRQFFLSR